MGRGAWWAVDHGVSRVRHDSLTKHQQHQLYENKQNIHMYAFMYGFFKKRFENIQTVNEVIYMGRKGR